MVPCEWKHNFGKIKELEGLQIVKKDKKDGDMVD